MKAVFYEIWSNNERRIWKVYTDLTDDVRAELARNGWSFVLKNEELDKEIIEKPSKTSRPIKKRSIASNIKAAGDI